MWNPTLNPDKAPCKVSRNIDYEQLNIDSMVTTEEILDRNSGNIVTNAIVTMLLEN